MDSLKDLSQGPRKGPNCQVETVPGASFDLFVLVVLTSLLAACGSASDSASDSSTSAGGSNHAPQINTANTVQMPEHKRLVSSLVATDRNADQLLWSIQGGADSEQFIITANGDLKFLTAADYENPTDTNTDNIYQLTISVSDGRATDSEQFSIEVSDRLEGRVGGAKVCNSEEYANSTYNAANLSGSAWLLASTLSASNSKICDSITGEAYASGKLSCNGYSSNSLGLVVSAEGAMGTDSCGNSNPVACCK
jgi:hypothetical protein